MKSLVAGLLTAAILAAMLFLGSREQAVKAPSTELQTAEAQDESGLTPAEEAVRSLIRRGDEGDVSGYLESFTSPLRERLEREVATRGRESFADDLRLAAGARKGHAVYAAVPDGIDAARVAVETVYPDRNERRNYRVVRTADGWRVAEVATVRTHQPAIRFGASANPNPPEAEPTQAPASPKVGVTVETGDDPDSP